MTALPVTCTCGVVHPNSGVLHRVGWAGDAEGGVMLLVNCNVCRSTITARTMDGPSVCAGCRSLVMGDFCDVKVCVVDPDDGPLVLCGECFRRDRRQGEWTRWAPEVTGPSARRMLVEPEPGSPQVQPARARSG